MSHDETRPDSCRFAGSRRAALLFAQGDVTIEGLNDAVHALSTDLTILAKALRRLDDRVAALEAAQIIPAGEFCVVSANTGIEGPTGFRLRPETLDRRAIIGAPAAGQTRRAIHEPEVSNEL